MEDKARKVFKDKLKGFETPVADNLWASIDAGVNGAAPSAIARWKWVGIVFLLFTFIGVGYLLLDGSQEKETLNDFEPREVESTPAPVELPDGQQEHAVHDKAQTDSIDLKNSIDQSPMKVADLGSGQNLVFKSVSDEPILEQLVSTIGESEEEVASIEVSPTSEIRKIYGLPFSPAFWEIDGPELHELAVKDSVAGEVEKTSGLITFKWHGALTFNYLNITPNTQDDVFFNAPSSGFDFSLDRIGIRPGIEMLIPINEKLSFKNDFLVSFRRYSIAFDYINDASQTENVFGKFANTYSQISVGISTGLSYQFILLNQRKIDLDLGVSLEQMLSDQIRDELLLDSPQQILSLNIGLSLYPRDTNKMNWVIRPFGFLSLNRKASAAPAKLTPFGFGIQFSRSH